MEKFAVDLEKVLDEFEFNEEREEQEATTVIKNQPLPHLGPCQVSHNRPPAASYRRPSFEPINLSDADFAASPPSITPTLFNSSISVKQNLNKDPSLIRQNGARNRNYIPTSSIIPDSIVNIKDVLVETEQELRSDRDSWPGIESPSSTEEKPDLLESKPNDYLKDVILPPQLPDVTTSVWSLSNGISSSFDEPLKNAPLCDLIHSSNGNLYDHIKHNNMLQENVSNDKSDNHTNFQFNSNVNVSSEKIEENNLFSKYTENIHSPEPSVFNPYIYSDVKSIQNDIKYPINDDKITKKTEKTSEFYENDGNFGQSVDDMYKTLNKEGVSNHKEEISGSLNTLHQATELQQGRIINNNEFVDEDDNHTNKISTLSKSFFNKDSNAVTAEININKISNFNKVSSNHDRQEENECNETNIPVLSKSDETFSNSLEVIQNVISCKQNTTENNLCHKDNNTKPIGFSSNNNITDSELQQYLDELEHTHNQELCLNTEQSKCSKDISLDESNILTANKLPETNEKPCKLQNRSLEKMSNNTNIKDTNSDLSLKLYNHVNSVECSLQSSCADLNPNMSPVIARNNGAVLSSFGNELELGNDYPPLKKGNTKDCENDLATGLSLSENASVSLNSQNILPVSVENVCKKDLLENSEYMICSEKTNISDGELISNVERQVLDKPVNTSVEISEKLHEEETCVESSSINASELSQNSDVTKVSSLNHAKQEDNSEPSLTEDISGDSESSNSYIQKVVKYKQVIGNEDMQNVLEKENTVDCDSLMSQESLEEDSFNQTLNLNAISTQSLDSPSQSSNSEYDTVLNISAKMIPVKTAVESTSQASADEAGVAAEEDKPPRPNSLELPAPITVDTEETSTMSEPPTTSGDIDLSPEERRLGKVAPVWVPDSDAPVCMQCQLRFTVLKRRHHCRACGQVLCSKCCSLKARLEFCGFSEVRVCQPCFSVLETVNGTDPRSPLGRQPNPNNPMEYCSTIPPLQQVAGSLHQPPPSVMVPVGVLKREGRGKSDVTKQVMFSDGIRPGGDLTELDGSGEPRIPFRRPGRQTKRVGTPPGGPMSSCNRRALDPTTQSFIPKDGDTALPPIVTHHQGELTYSDHEQPITLNEGVFKFAVNRNLNVLIKRVLLDCCVNRECWCISSDGLSCVGQDEVVYLLECLPQETLPPKDVFLLINSLYQNAAKGTTVSEMSFTPVSSNKLLGSRDHGGFLYIRPSYQCTAQLILPPPPYLFALLIHRWETPWARLFPIRLILRLGAEFRYYPCPLVSVRHREPLYTDIGHTIINLLADFRKYSYTLPTVRGLVIHMEDRQTSILLPRNRYDQVIRALNNSNDSVLAFGANFSLVADSHLVCMQSTEDESTSYHTQAINIHNKPRRVTGASFVVFNGALKTPGLAGKSNIVEDGLMVQVPSETMIALRTALRDMHDYTIGCGPHAEETVLLQWTADDTNFNIGVKSCIDGKPLDGIPSIRVHSGTDYSGNSKLIRWTEVFILQSDEGTDHTGEPLDISRLSGSIAQATCLALVPLLDLLSAASLTTIAVRANIHPENVGYEAGGNGEKLPPFYMKSLDDELVAVVHQAALAAESTPATLELVFRIMEQG